MLITVIIHEEVPLLKKFCLFGGYVSTDGKDLYLLAFKISTINTGI